MHGKAGDMGTTTVRVQDGAGKKTVRARATAAEAETESPTVVNDAAQPEVYGLGAAARASEREAPPLPDGLATIGAALAADREEETGDIGEPGGDDADGQTGEQVGGGAPFGRSGQWSVVSDRSPDAFPQHAALPEAERDALVAHLRAAHPDAIPELITGNTVTQIVESVGAAKAVHARIATRAAAAPPIAVGAGPRGGVVRDRDRQPPMAKISAGLAARRES